MNYQAMQADIFKSMLYSESGVHYAEFGNDKVIVSPNGYYAYILPKKELCFKLEKCKAAEQLTTAAKKTEQDVLLVRTFDIKECDIYDVIRITDGKIDIYVKRDFLNLFSDCQFFGYSPVERILATNHRGDLIGIILPVDMSTARR